MSFTISMVPFTCGGICWQLSLLATFDLIAKSKNMRMYFNDSNWIFKSKNGWNDYFDSLDLTDNVLYGSSNFEIDASKSFDILGEYNPFKYRFKLSDYRDSFSKMINFNKELTDLMSQIMSANALVPGEFDSILIQRGDKICDEENFKQTLIYLEHLLARNTKTVFLQTDDYNLYLEMKEIINEKYNDIKLVCICPPWQRGVVHVKNYVNDFKNGIDNAYFNNYNDWLQNKSKTIEEFSPSEMKEYFEAAIIGLEICIQSRYMVIDFGSSNIARYLYIRHNNKDNIISTDNVYPWNDDTEICIPGPNFY
jgi:hypothetical protein